MEPNVSLPVFLPVFFSAHFSDLIALIAVVIFVIYWIHAFAVLYHLIRFGVGTRPKQAALLFLGGSFVLFIVFVLSVSTIMFSH